MAENQLLHRLFFTSSPCIAIFHKSLIINNNTPSPCIQRVSDTFAVKVVQNAIETVLSNLTAPIEKVIFCCFFDSDAEIYRAIYAKSRVET